MVPYMQQKLRLYLILCKVLTYRAETESFFDHRCRSQASLVLLACSFLLIGQLCMIFWTKSLDILS